MIFGRSQAPRAPRERSWVPAGMASFFAGSGGFGNVSVGSPEDAERSIAIRSSVNLIASLVSELPVTAWDQPKTDLGRQRVDIERKCPSILDPDGSGNGVEDWMYQALWASLMRGNVYGRNVNGPGAPLTQVDLVHPDRVTPDPECVDSYGALVTERPVWNFDGIRFSGEIAHWRSEPRCGVLVGPSVIEMHAVEIELPQAAVRFGRQWFSDGGHPSSMFVNEFDDLNDMSDDEERLLKQRIMSKMQGNREPLIMGRGWTRSDIQIKPEESQFLATLGYSAADCARMFGPGVPALLGYPTTSGLQYANVDSLAAHFMTFTLSKWLTRMERILQSMTPKGVFIDLDRSKLLATTPQSQYKAIQTALSCRLMNVNEGRAMIGMAPAEWGDEPNPIAGANVIGSDGTPSDQSPPADPSKDGGAKGGN